MFYSWTAQLEAVEKCEMRAYIASRKAAVFLSDQRVMFVQYMKTKVMTITTICLSK